MVGPQVWSSAESRELVGAMVWDKDDDVAMRFVTAASNLRCHSFGMQLQSLFKTKEIAGNIIPANAATNAIVAGMQARRCSTTV